ncbi:hypothetical protein H4217_005519 [Coemansia sp. RSA 1939]|nr:hypothetical protein H4217_005519 [Coemansia sp. RSA 1939]KAJ2607914.1 hypothetical protein EV177_005255 [Coemansia sp. RSA 1804]KAJ2692841.1 hypothetical protein GGH99_001478 [Coemansia sp. RSA 1285]
MHFIISLVIAIISIGIVVPEVLAGKPNVIGYYASWKQPQAVGVDFSKYTHINLSFGSVSEKGAVTFDKSLSIPNIVKQIHGNNTKALVSLGGWSDSTYFSTLLDDTTEKNPLITSIVNFVDTNNLDGIDLDWEHPGRDGNGCNCYDEANDTPNYLKFVTNLRAAFTTKFGKGKKLITMAVYVQPFVVNGVPSKDVSGFAKSVDFLNLMQYDLNGAWSNITGPNAPLNFEKGKGTQLSFASAIDEWTKAGWPASQINAGLAFYGRATTASEDMTKNAKNMYQAQEKGVLPQADKEDIKSKDPCTNVTSFSGIWQWKHLRDQGVLTETEKAASPWVRTWDDTTKTPWLFNPKTKMFVSYDDPKSLTAKVDYAKSKGLAGSMVWAMYMDYKGELLDTVIKAWGGATGKSNSDSLDDIVNIETVSCDPFDDENDDGEEEEKKCGASGAETDDDDDKEEKCSEAKSDAEDDDDDCSSSLDDGSDSSGTSPVKGQKCTEAFYYKCGKTGVDTAYYICLYGTWVEMACAAGTVCVQNGKIISCGWPSK